MSIFTKVQEQTQNYETKLKTMKNIVVDEINQHVDDLNQIDRVKLKYASKHSRDYDIDLRLNSLIPTNSYKGKFIKGGRCTDVAYAVMYLYGERCPLLVVRNEDDNYSFWTAYMSDGPGWSFNLGERLSTFNVNDSEQRLREMVREVLPKFLEWRKTKAN